MDDQSTFMKKELKDWQKNQKMIKISSSLSYKDRLVRNKTMDVEIFFFCKKLIK